MSVNSVNDLGAPTMVEGIARVVSVEGDTVLLEPETSGSCGSCASSATCGTKGIGTSASKLEARRFRVKNPAGLVIGERIVIGIPDSSLLRASFTAYMIPLAAMLLAGVTAQWLYASDLVSMAATLAGLLIGLGIARLEAKRLHHRGDLSPQYLRRALPGEICNS